MLLRAAQVIAANCFGLTQRFVWVFAARHLGGNLPGLLARRIYWQRTVSTESDQYGTGIDFFLDHERLMFGSNVDRIRVSADPSK